MDILIKPVLVNSRRMTQTQPVAEDSLLEKATHYHVEAMKHQQEGDHEKAARDIILALRYYREVE
jgi:hypothetical protein